ncbi:ABC transporter ATP-binding protein [Halosquirtibacter laminarini]|uniref:ABC transporter ATP-binding protein n=1 Tax=Halosquirtibacter laminarini TaxID=3374600 RepID=A0AC61NCY6_9BACT|nr:ABC transporter ATP-binding protein [Prolixibacteraceae bacterium]
MENDMNRPVLSFHNLTIGYGKGPKQKVVAKELIGSLKRGVLTSIIGSNGTGKSTLLRTLAGFQTLLDGEVFYGMTPISEISNADLSKKVSVVLTDRIEVPNATVFEIASLGRSPYNGRWNRLDEHDYNLIIEALDQCGILHKKEDLLSSLSDGERQKVFIAKALIQQTDIIILDEPAAFLDFTARIEVMKLLRDIAKSRNISILLSSHDLDLALQLSDNIWLFYPHGPLVEGIPEDLLFKGCFNDILKSDHLKYNQVRARYEVYYETFQKLRVRCTREMYSLLSSAFKRENIEVVLVEEITNDGVIWEQGLFSFVKQNQTVFQCETIAEIVHYTKRNQ